MICSTFYLVHELRNTVASRPEDKKTNVLKVIEDDIGYKEFNITVNEVL